MRRAAFAVVSSLAMAGVGHASPANERQVLTLLSACEDNNVADACAQVGDAIRTRVLPGSDEDAASFFSKGCALGANTACARIPGLVHLTRCVAERGCPGKDGKVCADEWPKGDELGDMARLCSDIESVPGAKASFSACGGMKGAPACCESSLGPFVTSFCAHLRAQLATAGKAVGVVSVGRATSTDHGVATLAQRTVKKHVQELKLCYDSLGGGPFRADLEVRFEATVEGKFGNPAIGDPQPERAGFEECLLVAFRRWTLPKRKAPTNASIALSFSPAK